MAFAETPPLLIAHRGASYVAPENTLASFKLALEEGADGIEGDFRLSSDGEVVCMHDADTKRVSRKTLVVSQTPWKDLAELDVGSWKSPTFKNERIPRLADVLAILPQGKKFFLEIKAGPEIVIPIRKILESYPAHSSQVVLISFDRHVISSCRKELPQYEAHWISTLKDCNSKAQEYEQQLNDCGAKGLQFDSRANVEAAWLSNLRSKGLQLTAWTVDDPQTAHKMIDLGVQHITTNRPGPLRKELSR